MDAILVFASGNHHALSWMLDKAHRHVFVCVLTDNGWVKYDWRDGNPTIESFAAKDFDLSSYYRDGGYEVLSIQTQRNSTFGPFMLNNCVGHAKLILGINSFSITPHQLYCHLSNRSILMRIMDFIKQLSYIPGFGGAPKAAAPPPPPPPPPPPAPVAKKADEAVSQARRDEQKRARIQAGQGGTVKTGPLGVQTPATTTKTLLGS
tara:strand:- start:4480 stop:5097 length:618 start_codon:yes stop_codon:yes gene_type:complete